MIGEHGYSVAIAMRAPLVAEKLNSSIVKDRLAGRLPGRRTDEAYRGYIKNVTPIDGGFPHSMHSLFSIIDCGWRCAETFWMLRRHVKKLRCGMYRTLGPTLLQRPVAPTKRQCAFEPVGRLVSF
jgi:hypothetical protein